MEMNELLLKIGDELENYRFPEELKTKEDFINALRPLLRLTHSLLLVGISAVATEKHAQRGRPRSKAVIVGVMTRLMKLFQAFYQNIEVDQEDIVAIFTRLIFETEAKLSYLIKNPRSWKSYIMTSFRSEQEILKDLRAKAKSRALTPIEERIRKSIRRTLKRERISEKALIRYNWKELDGKSFRGLLEALGRGAEYPYSFGNFSHNVHGSWMDMSRYHLKKSGRGYQPRLSFRKPDPRYVGPITMIVLDALWQYMEWSKADHLGAIKLLCRQLLEDVQKLDGLHEAYLVAKI